MHVNNVCVFWDAAKSIFQFKWIFVYVISYYFSATSVLAMAIVVTQDEEPAIWSLSFQLQNPSKQPNKKAF